MLQLVQINKWFVSWNSIIIRIKLIILLHCWLLGRNCFEFDLFLFESCSSDLLDITCFSNCLHSLFYDLFIETIILNLLNYINFWYFRLFIMFFIFLLTFLFFLFLTMTSFINLINNPRNFRHSSWLTIPISQLSHIQYRCLDWRNQINIFILFLSMPMFILLFFTNILSSFN